jgi:hypothetical protein
MARMNSDSMKEQLLQLLRDKNNLHPEDPRRMDYFDKIVNLMQSNAAECIELMGIIDEDIVAELASTFSTVASHFQDPEFIRVIEKLPIRFPNFSNMKILKMNIDQAKDAMD